MNIIYDDINVIIINKLKKKELYKLKCVNKYFNNLVIENISNITQIIKPSIKNYYYNALSIRVIDTQYTNTLTNILNKFKNYNKISFENFIVFEEEDKKYYHDNIFTKLLSLKLCNCNLINSFKYENYTSLKSLTLDRNNDIEYINNNNLLDNLILLTQLTELYIDNVFNKYDTVNLNKLTKLTNLNILGLCNIRKNVCNDYIFLKDMTKLKKLYLNNNFKSITNIYAPLCLDELYIKGIYNELYYISYLNNEIFNSTFLNIKVIDISESPYIYIEQIINIIKIYYRSLEKLFINNCNLGDLKISKLANFIKNNIPELTVELHLKFNRFNYNSLINLHRSAKNVKIFVNKYDICVCDNENINDKIIKNKLYF